MTTTQYSRFLRSENFSALVPILIPSFPIVLLWNHRLPDVWSCLFVSHESRKLVILRSKCRWESSPAFSLRFGYLRRTNQIKSLEGVLNILWRFHVFGPQKLNHGWCDLDNQEKLLVCQRRLMSLSRASSSNNI